MSKILAIVGAGEAALAIIEKARELGVETLAFGAGDSLAKAQVDHFVECSIFDLEGMADACRDYGASAVIASSEITVEPAAQLAALLGLPGNRINGGFFARNKYLMRQAVAGLKSIAQPNFFLYEQGPIPSLPTMVKAVDSCGKKGIQLVRTEEEFKAAVASCREISSDGTVLIEDYLPGGREFSVECIASGEVVTVVQITEKETSGPPHFVEVAHHQPALISAQLRSAIVTAAEDLLKAVGITCGMAHLEIKVIDDKLYFIEVGARGGGDHIADRLTVLSTDFDYYKAAIDCAFGTYLPHEANHKAYTGIYFHCKENEGLAPLFQEAEKADWCVENTVVGGAFTEVKGNSDAAASGYVIYRANHRIGLHTVLPIRDREVVRINDFPDAFELMWRHNKEIGRTLSDEALTEGLQKFIDQGDALAILDGDHILAFLMLYCNDLSSLEAYICNVYVLEEYRGQGLAKKLLTKAVDIVGGSGFRTIKLHVASHNKGAVSLYQDYGFEVRDQNPDNEEGLTMVLDLARLER